MTKAVSSELTLSGKTVAAGELRAGALLDLTVSLMLHDFLYRYMYQLTALHPDIGFDNTGNQVIH